VPLKIVWRTETRRTVYFSCILMVNVPSVNEVKMQRCEFRCETGCGTVLILPVFSSYESWHCWFSKMTDFWQHGVHTPAGTRVSIFVTAFRLPVRLSHHLAHCVLPVFASSEIYLTREADHPVPMYFPIDNVHLIYNENLKIFVTPFDV
jgi:hypothetical protein